MAFHPYTVAVFLLSFGMSLSWATVAFAQTGGGVDFTPLAENILTLAVAALTVLATFGVRIFMSWAASKARLQDTEFERIMAERLSDILYRGIDYASMELKAQLADPNSPIKDIKIDNVFVRMAAQYAVDHAPGLLKQFNLDQQAVERMVKSRLNTLIAQPSPDSAKVELLG